MKTCIYFVEKPGFPASASYGPPGAERLVRGYGFTPDGSWRPLALPAHAAGLLIDDRFLPSRPGLDAALRSLADWKGMILLDLERLPGQGSDALTELIRRLAGREPVLPAAWASLPHGAVLAGPRQNRADFMGWLAGQKCRYGSVVLDALPLRCFAPPGQGWQPWTESLPLTGFPCLGVGCLHCRLADGSVLLWDTKETLTERCRSAGVPCLVFREDWERLE